MKDDLKNKRPERPNRSLYSITNEMEQARIRYDQELQQMQDCQIERMRRDARISFWLGLTVTVTFVMVVVLACWELF
jgi:hypothetical protein